MAIKNIIFDFGAVLVDWNPHYVYDPYFGGKEKADWFLANICTMDWNGEVDKGKTIKQAETELIAKYPEWEKEILMYFGRWVEMVGKELPGMTDLIRQLKSKGYRVLGLSNWARETFSRVKDGFEFEKLLDGYIISGDVKMLKPDAEIYYELLRRFNLKASECIFIDDNPANIASAEAIGIRTIKFESPEKLIDELRALGLYSSVNGCYSKC